MLLQFKCPSQGNSRRAWYIPGAVARMGADWIECTWRAFWDEEAPSMRTIREHLRQLQDSGVLVAAPGDWLPILRQPEHPERRPRYPDSYHILETDDEARWWAEVGIARLEKNPKARFNPTLWAKLFGRWRAELAGGLQSPTAHLFQRAAAAQPAEEVAAPEVRDRQRAAAEVLEAAVVRDGEPLELLSALAESGARIKGAMAFQMMRRKGDLRGSVARLAQAFRRSAPIHNPAGWLVAAWRDSTPPERREAISAICVAAWSRERVTS